MGTKKSICNLKIGGLKDGEEKLRIGTSGGE
jgi:hypothetical protein